MARSTAATSAERRPEGRAAALPPDERRAMIVAATLPLLVEHGEMVTSRQIAAAAGIAEGTIFRVFADKDALIAAVIDMAFDAAPLERELAGLDPGLSFEDAVTAATTILQQRVIDLWRLVSSIGPRFHDRTRRTMEPSDALVALLRAHRDRLTVEPGQAAQLLRALTLSTTHPMLAEQPMAPADIVHLFLHGVAAGDAPC